MLSDASRRAAYNAATDYDVECMEVEEYLARFKYLILTVSGLGNAGFGDHAEAPQPADPLLLAAGGAAAARVLPRRGGMR